MWTNSLLEKNLIGMAFHQKFRVFCEKLSGQKKFFISAEKFRHFADFLNSIFLAGMNVM